MYEDLFQEERQLTEREKEIGLGFFEYGFIEMYTASPIARVNFKSKFNKVPAVICTSNPRSINFPNINVTIPNITIPSVQIPMYQIDLRSKMESEFRNAVDRVFDDWPDWAKNPIKTAFGKAGYVVGWGMNFLWANEVNKQIKSTTDTINSGLKSVITNVQSTITTTTNNINSGVKKAMTDFQTLAQGIADKVPVAVDVKPDLLGFTFNSVGKDAKGMPQKFYWVAIALP